MNTPPPLQNLITALVTMKPSVIVEAAAELDGIAGWSPEELRRHSAELRRASALAEICSAIWADVCSRAALNAGGYSASGTPARLEQLQTGAFCV